MSIELRSNYLCAVLSAGHYDHDIEYLQRENHNSGRNSDYGTLNEGDDDFEKDIEFIGTIHAGCFHYFVWNTFDCGGENHHSVASLQPDHDEYQEKIIPWLEKRCPGLRLTSKTCNNRI